jgi:hypothetical protein
LCGHAKTDEDQSPINVISALNSSKDASPATIRDCLSLLFINGLVVLQRAHMRKLLLSARQVQELAIRCMEQSDAKGKPDAHDPELKRA